MMSVADKMTIIAALRAEIYRHHKRAAKYGLSRRNQPALCEAHLAEARKLGDVIDRLQTPEE